MLIIKKIILRIIIVNEEIKECYREPPRKPRMLASGMNWQNKFKKHLTNSKYDSILYM